MQLYLAPYRMSPTCQFGGHRNCLIGNITGLLCHMDLPDHVIKGSCNFMGWNPSRYVATLPSLVALGTVVAEI